MLHEAQTYYLIFAALVVACALVVWAQSAKSSTLETSDQFKTFQRGFLLVFFLASLADWLQGPYVYALYASYNFSSQDIGVLFIAGFGSSLCLGTFAAGLADKYGRALNCKIYAVVYLAACVTKHSSSYWVLMLGRILGGVSTSILYSSFEAWMVSAHSNAGFDAAWLEGTFTAMTFCSGVAAIVGGVIASAANQVGGPIAPFDVSALVLVAVFLLVSQWTENKGSQDTAGSSQGIGGAVHSVVEAGRVLVTNERVLLLGVIQSLFEGAMFIFVFMWTPALEAAHAVSVAAAGADASLTPADKAAFSEEALPHGMVFASFMACIMLGSRGTKSLLQLASPGTVAAAAFLAAALLLAVPLLFPHDEIRMMLAFCGFEVVCGMYFPLAGIQRSQIVPEHMRSMLMNMFRVGLNAVVMSVLLNIGSMPQQLVFTLCSACLFACTLAQLRLAALQGRAKEHASNPPSPSTSDGDGEVTGARAVNRGSKS